MKTKKHFPVSMVITAILCVPALGQVELPPPEDRPFLISRPHPTLAGIDKLHIAILPSGTEADKDGLLWTELEAKVASEFNKAGIKLTSGLTGAILNIPEVRVHIDMLELAGSQQRVFRIQTSLSRAVYLARKREIGSSSGPELILKANVWVAKSAMEVVSAQDMPARVATVVLRQVGHFIESYLAANSLDKQAKPGAESAAAEYGYVASRRSDVFHKPECRWAEKISPENLVGYADKAEATESGKRPCRSCKP